MATTESKKTIKCKLCNIILRHKSSLARGQCTALASCAKRRAANGVKNVKTFLRNHSEASPLHVKELPDEETLAEQQSPDSTARNYVVGDVVEYHFCDTPNSWYTGVIMKTNGDGDVSIKFNDGDIYHDLPKYKRNASQGINMVRHFSKESAPTLPRCIRCGQIFKNTHGLKIHRARGCRPQSANNSKCMIPRCITCGRVFKSLKGLRIHHGHGCSQKQNTSGISMELVIKKQKNTNPDNLRCYTCGRTFATMKGLNIHRGRGCKNEKPENVIKVKRISHKSADGQEDLCKSGSKNIKTQKSTGADSLRCITCGRTFKSMKGLNVHRGHGCKHKKPENTIVKRASHKSADADILRCDTCGRTFETMKGLNIHRGRGCKNERPENIIRVKMASHKSAKGLNKSEIKSIKKQKSTDADILRCITCGRTFQTMKGLNVHRGHGCKMVNPENISRAKKGKSANGLEDPCKSGIKSDADTLRCITCGRTFKTMKGLNVHRGHGCKSEKLEKTRVKMTSHKSANGREDLSSRRCGRVSKNEKSKKNRSARGRDNQSARVRVCMWFIV